MIDSSGCSPPLSLPENWPDKLIGWVPQGPAVLLLRPEIHGRAANGGGKLPIVDAVPMQQNDDGGCGTNDVVASVKATPLGGSIPGGWMAMDVVASVQANASTASSILSTETSGVFSELQDPQESALLPSYPSIRSYKSGWKVDPSKDRTRDRTRRGHVSDEQGPGSWVFRLASASLRRTVVCHEKRCGKF